jgi:hypothetical protein
MDTGMDIDTTWNKTQMLPLPQTWTNTGMDNATWTGAQTQTWVDTDTNTHITWTCVSQGQKTCMYKVIGGIYVACHVLLCFVTLCFKTFECFRMFFNVLHVHKCLKKFLNVSECF